MIGGRFRPALGLSSPRAYEPRAGARLDRPAQGHADAQFRLGIMSAQGQGVPQDYAKVAKWFRKAAEQGDADAQYNLGIMYETGRGVPKDLAEAVKWYRKAAKEGNTRVLMHLATMYSLGKGVSTDFVQAYMFFSIAAAMGDERGTKGRDLHAKAMTSARIAKAKKLAREWMAAFEKRKKK